jgi:hypothetical protein
MSELLKVNVNDHTEKKNNLTYLSWAWAWAEVLTFDPLAEWEAVEYPQPDGTISPCMYVGGGTAMVKTRVTIKGKTRVCMLPVMDHRNKAIKDPDAFAINTAIMRCMTKAISMHGLGLYIYAGEDLPQGEEAAPTPADPIAASFRSSPTMGAMDMLPPEQQEYLKDLAQTIVLQLAQHGAESTVEVIEEQNLDNEQKIALWSVLDSKTRSAIKKAQTAMREAAAKRPVDINPHTGAPTLASVN